MKKLVVLLTLLATAAGYSQSTLGHVTFNNRVSTVGLSAPISYDGSGPATAGAINGAGTKAVGSLDWGGKFAQAGLYGGAAGTAEANLQLLVPAVSFRSGSLAGVINPGASADRTVPGTQPGQAAVFQVRAWDAGKSGVDSYEAALGQTEYYFGKSGLINIAQLGGNTFTTPFLGANTTATDGSAWGLQPFSITYVPEPSIIGLGILGAVAGLFVFRRRN